MQEPGREYSPSTGSGHYRYGFNGKENDNEVKGEGNQQDYGMRIYDPRLGRFLSVDPVTKQYPELTPYQFASNSPISGIDEDGLEWAYYGKDNKQISINSATTKDDKLKIVGVRWAGYDKDDKGNRTPKAGTVGIAYTFGLKGMTTSSVDSKGNGVQTWQSYESLSAGNGATDKKLGTLHNSVQDQMKSFILMSKNRFGIDLRVTDGFRTVEQQDKLYAQGRTTTGKIVTKARGGYSNHNFGLAIDVVPFENGKLNWGTKNYPVIGLIGESRGLEWGHRWKSIDDRPHFQNLQGKTLKELRALPKDAKGLPIIQ
ncbi:MAG: M15 family metallopeptidase [Bacteroidetes bacterium]|nr:M15 family metallopeptidase [Bacteroidota bacterium]